MIEFVDEGNASVGAPDKRVIKQISKTQSLPPSFLSFCETNHGKTPKRGKIKGTKLRIGRFLSLVDDKSKLPGPFRPHFEDSSVDERVMRGISAVIGYESATSRALYYGERLLPFAVLYCGDEHPDEMCIDRYYVDFLCFDFEKKPIEPPVVVWHSEKANKEFFKYDEGKIEEPNYKKFTTPLAKSFAELLELVD
ncbi:MAG: hypothetical protein K2X93_07010 [Candidatus Obscuribacterales bacterium]|nr:hypothetical protein [Candidatus Obscuribacterales bacterium]